MSSKPKADCTHHSHLHQYGLQMSQFLPFAGKGDKSFPTSTAALPSSALRISRGTGTSFSRPKASPFPRGGFQRGLEQRDVPYYHLQIQATEAKGSDPCEPWAGCQGSSPAARQAFSYEPDGSLRSLTPL